MSNIEVIQELFLEALTLEPGEARDSWLREKCSSEPDLFDEISRLLNSHQAAENYLSSDVFLNGLERSDSQNQRVDFHVGDSVGPYTLAEVLGQGGMGTVWRAIQEQPIRREVAIKVIRPELSSDSVIKRFEHERQTLALMAHPNIAAILDVGSTKEGRPYFVMELVRGVPITEYANKLHLTIEERIELFKSASLAIQHAHHRGIIHRDIKPSNILVAVQDNQPVVKVIDFGVAKAIDSSENFTSVLTGFQGVVGTLEYMSPEQAELSRLDIDTRSDIYSLGVVLYELLTGSTPMSSERIRKSEFLEALRIIREDEPTRPSSLIASSKTTIQEIASSRRVSPTLLVSKLKGDLDWIVMKCLEKDRRRRYESAAELARDIERYQKHEPIEARPPTIAYSLSKFAKRNRPLFFASVTVLLIGAVALLGTSLALIEARTQREKTEGLLANEKQLKLRAEAGERSANKATVVANQAREFAESERDTVEAINRFLLDDLLGQADPSRQSLSTLGTVRDPNISVRELLDRASNSIHNQFVGREKVEVELRLTIAKTYLSLGLVDQAKEQLTDIERLVSTGKIDSKEILLEANRIRGAMLIERGNSEEAEQFFDELFAKTEVDFGKESEESIQNLESLSLIAMKKGELQESNSLLDRAIALAVKINSNRLYHLKLQQANIWMLQGKLPLAEKSFSELASDAAKNFGEDHITTLAAKSSLARSLQSQGKFIEAEKLLVSLIEHQKRLYGDDHLDTAVLQDTLGVIYARLSRYSEAETFTIQALSVIEKHLGTEHPTAIVCRNHFANLLAQTGNQPGAIDIYLETIPRLEKAIGDDHPDTLAAMTNIASLLEIDQRPSEALPYIEKAVKGYKKRLGADHTNTLLATFRLGMVTATLGEKRKAADLIAPVYAKLSMGPLPNHPALPQIGSSLASLYLDLEEYTSAFPILEAQLPQLEKQFGKEDPRSMSARVDLAFALEKVGRVSDAEPYRKLSSEFRLKAFGQDSPRYRIAQIAYGENLAMQSKWELAAKQFEILKDVSSKSDSFGSIAFGIELNLAAAKLMTKQTDQLDVMLAELLGKELSSDAELNDPSFLARAFDRLIAALNSSGDAKAVEVWTAKKKSLLPND